MEGETSFPILLSGWHRDGLCKINADEITFWNDSRISLEHAHDVGRVMSKHQGIPKHVRVFEESTQLDWKLIEWLTAWVTMSDDMKARVPEKWKGMFPKVIHTTNPIGPSSSAHKRFFIDPRSEYDVEKVGKWAVQYIPALVEDNPSEDAEETRQRVGAIGDAAISDALLNANWSALVGEYFPEFDESLHMVPDFSPPYHWFRYRAFDWGSYEPFCVYWVCVSDGEPFRDSKNRERWFPRGSLIFYQEWYGCNLERPALGLGLTNPEIAIGIVERSEISHRNLITITDSKPFQATGSLVGPAQEFQKNGVPLTQVDTGPGSRVAGWSQVRSRLKGIIYNFADGPKQIPMIYFCENCSFAKEYIPALGRHPSEGKKEDAQEHGEATHSCDTIRMACMVHTVIKDSIQPMQSVIERELKESKRKNTISEIMKKQGLQYRL